MGKPDRSVAPDTTVIGTSMLDHLPHSDEKVLGDRFTGGGHAVSNAAVRQALLDLKAGGGIGEPRDTERFNATTSLLGLPEIYELEQRYATENA